MSEKIYKHMIEKDTTGAETGRNKGQTYLFEFGDNGTVYSAAFRGRLEQEDTDGLFSILHTKLYQDCPEAVRSYLEQKHLKYTDFRADKVSMTHAGVMSRAKLLLDSCSCDIVDRHIDNADYYYGIMDYQKWLDKDRCEGCYYAVKRTSVGSVYSYRIVGQIFSCDRDGCLQEGHFAIRTDDGERKLYSLTEILGEPVFPINGCVDIHGILAGIDGIHTALQAFNAAVR